MVICELHIHLSRRAFHPGDVIEGRVRFRLDEAGECAIRMSLAFGEKEVEDTGTEVFLGALPKDEWRVEPFTLRIPDDAAPTVRDVAQWEVVARAHLKLAFDELDTRTIRVDEPPGTYPDVQRLQVARTHAAVGAESSVAVPSVVDTRGGRTRRSLARDVAQAAAGTALMGVGVGLVAATKGFGIVHSSGLFVPGYHLTSPGLGRMRRWMAERKLGVVRVEYATVLEAERAALRVRAFVEPGLSEDGVVARLAVTARSQKLLEKLFTREVELARASRRGDKFEALIPLDGAPCRSGRVAPGVSIKWELSLHIDIPRWPDWVETFPLTVLPART